MPAATRIERNGAAAAGSNTAAVAFSAWFTARWAIVKTC